MEQLPGVSQKVQEYALRILNGEDADQVLQGADAFRPAVEFAVSQYLHKKQEQRAQEEEVDVLVASPNPVLSKEAIHIREQEDQKKVDSLLLELGIKKTSEQENPLLSEEKDRRKKIQGWSASYELAAIAKQKGVDLSALSREEYAQYAIDQYLAIDDAQLRVQPWQRNEVSVDDIVRKAKEQRASIDPAKEKEFFSFAYKMKELAEKEQKDRYIKDEIRVLSGTKKSDSWLFFSINNGADQKNPETYKSYFSLKDLNQFSPDQFVSFMEELQKRGYNGGVKIFQDLTEQGTRLNDQVVMHGFSEADANAAAEIAKEFFGQNIAETSVGKDEMVEVDGKQESRSYSQLLAQKIKEEINNKQ